MSLAPILLFAYNRPEHTRKTLEALQKNSLAAKSHLIAYCDGAKTSEAQARVLEVRNIIRSCPGFFSVKLIERDRNFGLAANIIDGVTQTVNEFGKVIVIEDDLVTTPRFLEFLNEGLDRYANEERVASIHAFTYPIHGLPDTYFIRGADCWGWATWKRAWNHFNPDGKALLRQLEEKSLKHAFDMAGGCEYVQMLQNQIDGKISSWAIRWHASTFVANMLTLYPGRTFVKNIGFDSGTHFQNEDVGGYQSELDQRFYPKTFESQIQESELGRKKMVRFHKRERGWIRKIQRKLSRLFFKKN